MKITIKVDGENKEEDLILTDEYLNNDNFVNMTVGEEEFTIPTDDLYSAIKTFRNLRALRIEREKGYEN